jgi:hypothetical protein
LTVGARGDPCPPEVGPGSVLRRQAAIDFHRLADDKSAVRQMANLRSHCNDSPLVPLLEILGPFLGNPLNNYGRQIRTVPYC